VKARNERYGITWKSISSLNVVNCLKIKAFEEALQKLFGLGYIFLESLFLKHLHNATGEDLQGCKTFADCVRSLRMKAEAVEPQAMSPLLLEPNL